MVVLLLQRFEHLHRAIARAKRAEVAGLTLSLYEMSLSVRWQLQHFSMCAVDGGLSVLM